MRSGSDPQKHEVVESDNQEAGTGLRTSAFLSDQEAVKDLVRRLGGENALVEQLTSVLEGAHARSGPGPDENTDGYCYLRLFDRVEHRDAMLMGPRPTVAEVRRFSNGRADPFGSRQVVILVHRDGEGRIAHVTYNGGSRGLRPVEALSALAKDCRVGGLPDGVSDEFPPKWIPAQLSAVQTWDFVKPNTSSRALDLLDWVGATPPWLDKLYEPISATTSRVRWVVRADPLGPPNGLVDIIDPAGKVISARTWTSYVAHTGHHQGWRVRGGRVFAEATLWRAARVLTDPRSPAPQPTPNPGHGDLLLRIPSSGASGVCSNHVKTVPAVTSDDVGFCYGRAFTDELDAIWTLGAYPKVSEVLGYAKTLRARAGDGAFVPCSLQPGSLTREGSTVHHVVPLVEGGGDLWEALEVLDSESRLGATMTDAAHPSEMENVNSPAALVLRPRGRGVLLHIPFVTVLKTGEEALLWDMTAGKKFDGLSSHFESVELVSLTAKVTVHMGDNDTLVTLAVDTTETPFSLETDWVGAAHTLLVSGNVNGATTGEMVVEGNHGFGTQLKGVSVGNPTPIVQVKLETTVAAKAYIKFILTVRAAGTGHPQATVLKARPAKGGMNGSAASKARSSSGEE